MVSVEPLTLARELTSRAKLPAPHSSTRLEGGRNNQAFRVSLDDGWDVVLKLYHHDPRDSRDRLGAEWNFLSYVWERGVRNVPQPIVKDESAHAALIGFVAGAKRSAIDDEAIAQAADFVRAINASPRDVNALAPGSEACFSFADHIGTVERRVARLSDLDAAAPHGTEALDLVNQEVQPQWHAISRAAVDGAEALTISLDIALDDAEKCISPSDFGFHNALVAEDGSATFIDFEYAGQDDPAKLICDFLCTPEIPVPKKSADSAFTQLADALDLSEQDRQRANLLVDAYRIKWICIMLNEFLPVGSARRDFAEQEAREQRCATQLEKVRHALNQLNTN